MKEHVKVSILNEIDGHLPLTALLFPHILHTWNDVCTVLLKKKKIDRKRNHGMATNLSSRNTVPLVNARGLAIDRRLQDIPFRVFEICFESPTHTQNRFP